jgi:hypothetical protein
MVRMVPDAIMVGSIMLSTTIANDTYCINIDMAQPAALDPDIARPQREQA